MKTFKDLKIGDCIYNTCNFMQDCLKYKITNIFSDGSFVYFVYGKFPWDSILISNSVLQKSQWGNLFADINQIIEYINENV